MNVCSARGLGIQATEKLKGSEWSASVVADLLCSVFSAGMTE